MPVVCVSVCNIHKVPYKECNLCGLFNPLLFNFLPVFNCRYWHQNIISILCTSFTSLDLPRSIPTANYCLLPCRLWYLEWDIDGYHGTFYHGNWRALHHHAACWLVNIHITWPFALQLPWWKDAMESVCRDQCVYLPNLLTVGEWCCSWDIIEAGKDLHQPKKVMVSWQTDMLFAIFHV